MLKSNYEFEVLVNGHPAREYYQNGSTYIEGKEGTKFSLRFKNNSWSKVLFVPTIDGLSVMDGKNGSFNSRGYIINAYDSITIEGWRTSNQNVAEFFFSSPKGSYAKKMGNGGNLGVIGGAVFKEECPHSYVTMSNGGISGNFPLNNGTLTTSMYSQTSEPGYTVTTASATNQGTSSFLCSANSSVSSSLGTGFGQDKASPVISATFNKQDNPDTVFTLFYNTRQNLETLGITFKKPLYVTPSAFPDEESYCKRPY
jgi:hypothetical protein